MQGRSLLGLLTEADTEDVNHPVVYSEYYNAMGNHQDRKAYATMIADDTYKLVYCHSSNEGELYDHRSDPGEHENLYYRPDYQAIRIRLLEEMTNRMVYTIDPLPVREAIY